MRYFLAMQSSRPGEGIVLSCKPFEQGRRWNRPERRYRGRYKTVVARLSTLNRISEFSDVGSGYPICSRGFLDALRAAGETHFQDFPVALRDREGRQDRKTYRLLRLYQPVECANREASEYNRARCPSNHPEVMVNIEKLVLHEDRIPRDRHFFSIRGTTCFAASEVFRREFLQRRLRGLVFIKHGFVEHFRKARFGMFTIEMAEMFAQAPPTTPTASNIEEAAALFQSGLDFELDPKFVESFGLEEVDPSEIKAFLIMEFSRSKRASFGEEDDDAEFEGDEFDEEFEDEFEDFPSDDSPHAGASAMHETRPTVDPTAPPWGRVVWTL